MLYPRTEYQRELLAITDPLVAKLADRAAEHDRNNTFPMDNYADMRDVGYLTLTVPREYGGKGADLLGFVLCQERLAQGDGATALAVGMHLALIGRLAETSEWPTDRFEAICRDVVATGATINSAASEAETGSPSRGGKPGTTARRVENGWVINGRKTFTTMSPALYYFLVSCSLENAPDAPATGNLLVTSSNPGLEIVETWNTMGMRATGSHDIVLRDCAVAADALIRGRSPSDPASLQGGGRAWGPLLVSAVYTGVAAAARNFALKFARERVPSGLGKPIAELPSIQARIGEMEIRLAQSRRFLYSLAQDWSDLPDERDHLTTDISTCKYLATNNAIAIVDWAMRVVGGIALSRSYPLERYYRDVRAGLYNPPMDDVTMIQLAKAALEENARHDGSAS